MKKRIVYSTLITVIFSLATISCCFLLISKIENINSAKNVLKEYSVWIKNNYLKIDDYSFDSFNINSYNINHEFISLDEIEDYKYKDKISDIKEDISFNIFNDKSETNEYFYAIKINEDLILVSSLEFENNLNPEYILYYFLIILIVIILSLLLASRLIRIIIYPIKEFEHTTHQIVSGEYERRIRIKSNDEIGILGRSFNDMAEQLEMRVKDSEDKSNKIEAILESMESGIIAIDNKQRVVLINKYAKKLFDIKEDIIGKNFKPYIFDYDIVDFILNKKNTETKEVNLIYPVDKIVKLKKQPIINYKNMTNGIVITIQDITDIKNLENIRSQFVANVSHELKTPLTSIKGFSETLRYVDDEDTRNKFLDIIDKESDRLYNLINDILILSKIENTHKMKEERFSKIDIIKEVRDVVNPQLKEKNIKIEIEDLGNPILIGDQDKFYQMILNLVSNAIKYSNNDKVIKIKSYEDKVNSIIEIEDEGYGIPKEDIPRIFERFYIVDKSRAEKGTGLGLAIVKHIIKMFNGEIYVKSELGVGSTFIVKLKKR